MGDNKKLWVLKELDTEWTKGPILPFEVFQGNYKDQIYEIIWESINEKTRKEFTNELVKYIFDRPVLNVSKTVKAVIKKLSEKVTEEQYEDLKLKVWRLFWILEDEAFLWEEKELNGQFFLVEYQFNEKISDIIWTKIEDFFKNLSTTYRSESLSALFKYFEKNKNKYESDTDLLDELAKSIDFPREYIKMLLQYLLKFNFITLNEHYSAKLTKNGEFFKETLLSNTIDYEGENRYWNISDDSASQPLLIYISRYIAQQLQTPTWIKNISWTNEKKKFRNNIRNHLQSIFWFSIRDSDLQIIIETQLKKDADELWTFDQANFALKSSLAPYEISQWNYIFTITRENQYWPYKQKISISVDKIDELFSRYVSVKSGGLWQSKHQVLRELQINDITWGELQRRLKITKDSRALWPASISQLNEEQIVEKVNKIQERIKADSAEKQLQEEKLRRAERIIKSADFVGSTISQAVKKVFWEIPKIDDPYTLKVQKPFISLNEYKNLELQIRDTQVNFMGDMQFFKVGHDTVVKNMINVFENAANSHQQKHVIKMLWDTFELALLHVLMHGSQIDWVEKQYLGMSVDDALELVVWYFLKWIKILLKADKDIILTNDKWNHDRLTDDKRKDYKQSWALILWKFLETALIAETQTREAIENGKLRFLYNREKWSKTQSMWVEIIAHHGDEWIASKITSNGLYMLDTYARQITTILDTDGIPPNYYVHVAWHIHHHTAFNAASDLKWIIIPALAGQGSFDKEIWVSSNTWYISLERDYIDRAPRDTFHSLEDFTIGWNGFLSQDSQCT